MNDTEILARTIYGEARGESPEGRIAVAWVIKNRADNEAKWDGTTIAGVCLKPKQFSCWDDHNRLGMMTVEMDNPVFNACMYVALSVMTDRDPDPTSGSCHYAVIGTNPSWAKGHTFIVRIGNHEFWNDID